MTFHHKNTLAWHCYVLRFLNIKSVTELSDKTPTKSILKIKKISFTRQASYQCAQTAYFNMLCSTKKSSGKMHKPHHYQTVAIKPKPYLSTFLQHRAVVLHTHSNVQEPDKQKFY
jgi:hypothetical protein